MGSFSYLDDDDNDDEDEDAALYCRERNRRRCDRMKEWRSLYIHVSTGRKQRVWCGAVAEARVNTKLLTFPLQTAGLLLTVPTVASA